MPPHVLSDFVVSGVRKRI